MSVIVAALAPVLALILLGFALRRMQFVEINVWAGLERLTYFVLFPALLIHTLGRQDLGNLPWERMLAVVALALAGAVAALLVWRRVAAARGRPIPDPTFTSIFQGGVRFNTYIALALIQAFLGPEGVVVGAVVFGFMIVLVNLLCISAFALWGERGIQGPGPFLRAVFGNPLILACLAGWTLSLSGIGLPGVSAEILEIVGRAALPLGLLVVGAALRPEEVRAHLGPAALASLVQFGLKPLLAVVLTSLFGLDPLLTAVFVIVLMTPTAPSSYILARQLGGDTGTMASIITLQTLLAFAVMPVVVALVLPGI
ncbi:MAG: AEC family transporter [Gammaproteobacteria bacterium]|nr:AEC family transporter [Gammaproteobacteria bacterium]